MDIIQAFTDYFKQNSHTIVPSSSLLPKDDTSVLLTTAGMQQFKPYYTGVNSPYGNRVASVQKCVRVDDIDEVGDDTHFTFFEMLGNFSFNYAQGQAQEKDQSTDSYFKKQAIQYAYEFIAEVLKLQIDYVTIFQGDQHVPKDIESKNMWQALANQKGVELTIKECGRQDNFWGPTGSEGPCGPTTEIYVDGVEVWNVVFNQYYQNRDKSLRPLEIQGIDTGAGFERLQATIENVSSFYDSSLFKPIISEIKACFSQIDQKQARIIADHLRASMFLISDGVIPSNKDQGYIVRRLFRKVFGIVLDNPQALESILKIYSKLYQSYIHRYPDIDNSDELFKGFVTEEYGLFLQASQRGIRQAEKMLTKKRVPHLSGEEVFLLSATYGLAPDVLEARGLPFNRQELEQYQSKHQQISRAGAEKKFGGHGLLLNTGELKAANEEEVHIVTRLHTATHLTNKALRLVLGQNVEQRGSDITAERARFDFSFDRKLTEQEKSEVEQIVNTQIEAHLNRTIQEVSLLEAKTSGAIFMSDRTYPDHVSLYSFGDFSKEICGGPHVENTGEIGKIKIKKEEAVARGVRRIRLVLQ